MLGAIIGDVAGSYYEVLEVLEVKQKRKRAYEERIKILDKNTPLFHKNSSCTDDSILTYSIYDAIKNNDQDYGKYLRLYGQKEVELGCDIYGRSRFGKGFIEWLQGNFQGTSYGNGAAMRISPIGYLFNTIEEVKENAYLATIPSHNHPEAIKGAECIAVSIFLLRTGHTKDEVKKYVKANYYSLDYDLEDLRHNYKFSSKTINSVPQALFCFFESNDFESTIRNAISIGGDTDTIACIAGSLAEAIYEIPDEIIKSVKPYLREYMQDILSHTKTKRK